jgi:hypothetical protein
MLASEMRSPSMVPRPANVLCFWFAALSKGQPVNPHQDYHYYLNIYEYESLSRTEGVFTEGDLKSGHERCSAQNRGCLALPVSWFRAKGANPRGEPEKTLSHSRKTPSNQ